MFALNVVLTINATLWAVTSGGLYMYDPQSFLFEVMENDSIWANVLNIGIKVETCIVSTSAQTVLQDMGKAISVNSRQLCSSRHKAGNEVSNHQKMALAMLKKMRLKKAKKENTIDEGPREPSVVTTNVGGNSQNEITSKSLSVKIEHTNPVDFVIVNALHVVAHIVSSHYEESEALEFGLSVVASAVRCHVLQIISIMMRAIDEMTDKNYSKLWYYTVWDNLDLFINKIAWLRETLVFEGALYRLWENVITNINGNAVEPDMDTLVLIRDLVDESLYSACEHSSYEQIAAILKFNPETDQWKSPQGIISMFDKSSKNLQNVFQAITISTVEPNVWSTYLNKLEAMKDIKRQNY